MKQLKSISIFFIMLVFLVSCSEDLPTEVVNTEATNASGQPMPEVAGVTDLNGILSTIYYDFDSGIEGIPAIGLSMGYAQFGSMVDGGTVTINNNELSKTTQGSSIFYMKPGTGSVEQLNNVSFNGLVHKWSVSGSGDIPSFDGDISSPTLFTVTAPANKSTITKANGINITWIRTGQTDEKILINLISLSGSNSVITEQDLENSGSYKIEASRISSLSGEYMLQIVKYRYKEISANNKAYLIISEVVKTLTLTI
jgi:hypothetical protein